MTQQQEQLAFEAAREGQLSGDESLVVYSQLWYAVALVDQAYPIRFQLKANVNSVKKFADLINTISGPN